MTVVYWRSLRQARVSVLSYGLGLALYAGLMTLMYPTMESTMAQMSEGYPQEILDAFGISGVSLADPRGFLAAEFFSMVPLILGAFAVFAATGALAGEESAGTMEFLAALPLSRRALFGAKVLALATAAAAACALICAAWFVTVPLVDFHGVLEVPALVGATFAQLSFVGFVTASGLLLGALAPTRSAAAAWTGLLLIVAYLLVAIAGVVEAIDWIQYLSPYYYADLADMLVDGVQWPHFALLWALNLGLLGAAARAFDGRELGSERWQFRAVLDGAPSDR